MTAEAVLRFELRKNFFILGRLAAFDAFPHHPFDRRYVVYIDSRWKGDLH